MYRIPGSILLVTVHCYLVTSVLGTVHIAGNPLLVVYVVSLLYRRCVKILVSSALKHIWLRLKISHRWVSIRWRKVIVETSRSLRA